MKYINMLKKYLDETTLRLGTKLMVLLGATELVCIVGFSSLLDEYNHDRTSTTLALIWLIGAVTFELLVYPIGYDLIKGELVKILGWVLFAGPICISVLYNYRMDPNSWTMDIVVLSITITNIIPACILAKKVIEWKNKIFKDKTDTFMTFASIIQGLAAIIQVLLAIIALMK